MLVRVGEELAESCRVKQQFSEELKSEIARLAEEMAATLRAAGTIFWMGNGGSAADAQHLAAELVGRLRRSRRALASVALTTNTSILTAVANDTSYAEIFSRQVEALIRPADMLIGLSTSGNSESVLRAVQAANERGTPFETITRTALVETSLADTRGHLAARSADQTRAAAPVADAGRCLLPGRAVNPGGVRVAYGASVRARAAV